MHTENATNWLRPGLAALLPAALDEPQAAAPAAQQTARTVVMSARATTWPMVHDTRLHGGDAGRREHEPWRCGETSLRN
jgi:hypothetical protein